MRWRRDDDCDQCNTAYYQPFRRQPLRFLWWLDDALHRLHITNWLSRRLCDHVDRALFPKDLPGASMGGQNAS